MSHIDWYLSTDLIGGVQGRPELSKDDDYFMSRTEKFVHGLRYMPVCVLVRGSLQDIQFSVLDLIA